MKSRPTTTFLQLLLLSLLKRVKVGLFTNRPNLGLLFILSVPLNFPFWGGGWAKFVLWFPSTFCPGGIAPPPSSVPVPLMRQRHSSNYMTLHRPICRSVDKGLANPALGAPLAKRTLQRRQQISTPLKKNKDEFPAALL